MIYKWRGLDEGRGHKRGWSRWRSGEPSIKGNGVGRVGQGTRGVGREMEVGGQG